MEKLEKIKNKLIVAVDFDGTIVKNRFPIIGPEVPWAIPSLHLLQNEALLILLTMREGKQLGDAVKYCLEHGVSFWGINENPEQKNWSGSRKIFAHLYIDDSNASDFLICPEDDFPYVDWMLLWTWFEKNKDKLIKKIWKGDLNGK